MHCIQHACILVYLYALYTACMHTGIPCTCLYKYLYFQQYPYQSSTEITSYAYYQLYSYIINTHYTKVASVVLMHLLLSLQYTMCMYSLIAQYRVDRIYKYLSYILQSFKTISRTTAVPSSTKQCFSMVNAQLYPL